MDADGLAARLMNGKPVTPERIAKVPKHLISVAHYQAFLRALPADVWERVDAQLKDTVERKFA